MRGEAWRASRAPATDLRLAVPHEVQVDVQPEREPLQHDLGLDGLLEVDPELKEDHAELHKEQEHEQPRDGLCLHLLRDAADLFAGDSGVEEGREREVDDLHRGGSVRYGLVRVLSGAPLIAIASDPLAARCTHESRSNRPSDLHGDDPAVVIVADRAVRVLPGPKTAEKGG